MRAGFVGRVGQPQRQRPFADPRSYDSLDMWLDASDAATISKDGSNLVAAWNDKGSNAQNFTQATSGNKPTWVANELNGLPIIRFTYSGSSSTASRMSGSKAITAAETTFFMVLKTPTRTGATEPIFYGIGNISNGVNGSDEVINWTGITGSTDGVGALRNADVQAVGQYIILSGRRSASQNNIEIRENGAVIKKTTHTATATVGQTPRINWDTVPNYGQADIAAIIVYRSYLNDVQMLNVENYLNKQWAVYTNFAERRGLHRGVQRYCTANSVTSLAGLPSPKPLYMIYGQSNAGGEGLIADLSAPLQAAITNANIWNPTNSAWETLDAGVNNLPNSGAGTKHGTEITLMADIAADFGESYLVKWTEGGTNLAVQWLPTTTTNSRYQSAIIRTDAARYKVGLASGLELTPTGIVWYQGEDDTTDTYAPLYQANEALLFSYFRNGTDISGAQAVRIVSVLVNNTNYTANYVTVNAAKVANAAALSNVYTTPGWTTAVDSVHADSASLQAIGNAIALLFGATTQVS